MGTSMGCMHGFVWGTTHAEMIQAMMPLACLPKTIAGHNRMWRKAAMDGIRADPAWQNGDYAQEPAQGLRTAVSLLQVMGFATLYEQTTNPTRESADAAIEARIERALVGIDANDMIYQLDASRHYDPSDALEKVTMPVSWINSADDLINPWNYGIAEDFAKRMPRAHYVLIPASSETRGHATHTWAKFWKQELVDLLARSGAGD
jgi:homoserine O-acetyltransferase